MSVSHSPDPRRVVVEGQSDARATMANIPVCTGWTHSLHLNADGKPSGLRRSIENYIRSGWQALTDIGRPVVEIPTNGVCVDNVMHAWQ